VKHVLREQETAPCYNTSERSYIWLARGYEDNYSVWDIPLSFFAFFPPHLFFSSDIFIIHSFITALAPQDGWVKITSHKCYLISPLLSMKIEQLDNRAQITVRNKWEAMDK